MTVAGIIEKLSNLDQSMIVYVEIQESGIWEIFPDMIKVSNELSVDGNSGDKVIFG